MWRGLWVSSCLVIRKQKGFSGLYEHFENGFGVGFGDTWMQHFV